MSDQWLEERNEAIKSGKFETATLQGLEKRAKSFITKKRVPGKKVWRTTGKVSSGSGSLRFEFDLEDKEYFENFEKKFSILSKKARSEIREWVLKNKIKK